MVDQQSAHLPSVAHLFNHDASNGAAIPLCGRILQQVPLLFDAGKFCITLVDDHVHECVAHLLGRDLAQVLPFAAALVRTELDLFGFNGAIQRVEVEGVDVFRIDTNIFAPIVEQTDPVTEGSDFCYFSRHNSDLIPGLVARN